MNDPKIKVSTDQQWRDYYENKCREVMKENDRLNRQVEDLKLVCETLRQQIRFMSKEAKKP